MYKMTYKDPEKKKAYEKEYRENNKEYHKARHKEYRENNKEHVLAQKKEYYKNNKGRIKEYHQTEQGIKSKRINNWKQNGISVDYDFDIIHDIYINTYVCDFCNVELIEGNYGSNKKCLDHNHITGEIRGILCNTCNSRDVLN